MAQHPIVSIIMPCYNDGAYLMQAVQSCQAQTLPDWELIIVDDGSTDPTTLQVLGELSSDKIVLLHTAHVGPSGARNHAIQHARGRYILPLDADDYIAPEYLMLATKILDEQPDAGIVYCHAELLGEANGPWQLPPYSLEHFLVDNCIFITALFRKEDWEYCGGFCTDFRHGLEDYDFWLSLVEMNRQVIQLPDTLFFYRIKPASRSTELHASIQHSVETYELLYHRHKALFHSNIDCYCAGLRKALIEQKALTGQQGAYGNDPVAHYWQTVRLLKPKLANRIEQLLFLKDRMKKHCKEALQWLHRK